jgi:hypothetical protein
MQPSPKITNSQNAAYVAPLVGASHARKCAEAATKIIAQVDSGARGCLEFMSTGFRKV